MAEIDPIGREIETEPGKSSGFRGVVVSNGSEGTPDIVAALHAADGALSLIVHRGATQGNLEVAAEALGLVQAITRDRKHPIGARFELNVLADEVADHDQ